ncbi:hypothetical protein XFF6992_220122 [Xanthomonas citri pv. fuscans]|nr:hypothetical protein XFF6992_220122 [Xanthomonas citri pv. fuscans]SOO31856.1 hypothetical protein XFF6994_1570016 [Xanthomonas citri pv. fuscans]
MNIRPIFFERLDGSSMCVRMRITELDHQIPKANAQKAGLLTQCSFRLRNASVRRFFVIGPVVV